MTLSVNLVEGLWIFINLAAFSLTLTALVEARADRAAVKILNGHARELAADSIVRREAIRVVVQLLLLSVAVPGLFVDRPIVFTPAVGALMAVPVLILISSFLDARDRKSLTVLVAADLLADTTNELAAIRADIAENTEVSREAVVEARRAYHEANSLNEKIAVQGEALVAQGEDRAIAAEDAKRVEATIEETSEKVDDIHHATVPPK